MKAASHEVSTTASLEMNNFIFTGILQIPWEAHVQYGKVVCVGLFICLFCKKEFLSE